MVITDVKIRKIFEEEGPLKAVASVVFDDCLAVHDIKVIEARDKQFVVMPTVKMANGTYRDTVHPMTSELREELTARILDEYVARVAIESATAK